MTVFETGLLVLLVFTCVYIVIDRVCKCIEQGRMARCHIETLKHGSSVESNDVQEGTNNGRHR